jgi:hypothetical protein
MALIIIILLVLLLAGGGYGYSSGWHASYPSYYGGGLGIVGVIVIILIVFALLGRG